MSPWRAVLPAYVASRTSLLLVGYASMRMAPLGPKDAPWQFLPNDLMFDGLARWDSGWYRSIISWGYFYDNPGHENIHYLPVYPLLVGCLMKVFPGSVDPDAAFAYSAIFLSHLTFYFALAGVFTLARLKAGRFAANRCVWLMCLFPYSFFFSAAYTESMYLAFAVWAFVFAERGRWAHASLLAALASGTRIPGLFVGVSLTLIYLAQPQRLASERQTKWLWLLLAPLGSLLYAGYVGIRFGDPLLLVHVSTNLPAHYVRGIFMHVVHVFGQDVDITNAIERTTIASSIVIFALVLVMSVIAGRRFGVAYAFFPVASMALASIYTLDSNGRYASVLFPVFLAAASTLSTSSFRVTCGLSVPCGAVLYALFAHWRHIT